MTPAHHSATAHCDGGKKVMKLHLARQDCLMKISNNGHKGLEVTATNNKSSKNGTILGGYYTIILTRKHP